MTFTEATFDLFEAKIVIPWRSTDCRKTKKKLEKSIISYRIWDESRNTTKLAIYIETKVSFL